MPKGMGDFYSKRDENKADGLVPGIASEDGTPRGGRCGRGASEQAKRWNRSTAGLNWECIPPAIASFLESWDSLEAFSRIIEQSLRGFMLHAERPSHMDPPFSAMGAGKIHLFGSVAINLAGVYSNIVSITTVPRFRGVLAFVGTAAESAAAMTDISFRFTRGGNVIPPYGDIRFPIFNFTPPCPLLPQIDFGPQNETLALQAASISGAAHTAFGQIVGWQYPVHVEAGQNIRSTITDMNVDS